MTRATLSAPIPRRIRRLAFAALGLVFAGCGNLFQTTGGTSDTDNTVAVGSEVLNPDGSQGAGHSVLLRRDRYLSPFPAFGKRAASAADDKRDTLTDSLGRFRIDSVDTGDYFIEVADGDSLAALFRTSLSRLPRSVTLAPRALEATAKVTGTVLFRAGTYRVFVQAYGLERMVPVNMVTGRYTITLPAGYLTLRFVDPERAQAFAKTREVNLAAGQSLELDTVVLGDSTEPFAAWRHSSELVLNTAADGAGIASDLAGFPLLVRLDASNFDFTQALPGGADIRFSKSDGKTQLPFEIESWDAAARQAALWVRVDTVFGNRRTQSVYLYWGKADAADSSDAAAVFAPADGYAGVWHLAEAGGTAPGGYRDATGNGNRGTGQALGDTSAVAGLIGRGTRFAGRDQSIRIPDSPTLKLGTGAFTLSAWVRAEALTRKHQVLAKRAEPIGDYEIQVMNNGKAVAYPGPPGSGAKGFEGTGGVTTGKWHHLAFTREGNRILLYLDGIQNAASTTNVASVASDSALLIGQDGTGLDEGWLGVLDEVRVAARAHSADWIKLCHRTQAPGSQVLVWRRFP